MAARTTGFAMLSSASVQEAHDFALIAQAEAEGHTDQEAHMIAFEKKHGKNGKN